MHVFEAKAQSDVTQALRASGEDEDCDSSATASPPAPKRAIPKKRKQPAISVKLKPAPYKPTGKGKTKPNLRAKRANELRKSQPTAKKAKTGQTMQPPSPKAGAQAHPSGNRPGTQPPQTSILVRSDELSGTDDKPRTPINNIVRLSPNGAGPKCDKCKCHLYCGTCGAGQFLASSEAETLQRARAVKTVFTIEQVESKTDSAVTFPPYSDKTKYDTRQLRVIDAVCKQNFAFEINARVDSFACFLCHRRILPVCDYASLPPGLSKEGAKVFGRETHYCTRCCHAVYCSSRCKQYDHDRHTRHGCQLAFFHKKA